MKLYKIAEELRALDEKVRAGMDWDEETGEVIDLGKALDDIKMAWEDKVDNCLKLRSEYKREAEAIKAEADRLAKRARALENEAESLRDYVAACLELSGRDKIKTATHSARMQAFKSAFIDSVDELPEELRRVRVEANKSEVLKRLKAGETVPGAHLVESRKVVVR